MNKKAQTSNQARRRLEWMSKKAQVSNQARRRRPLRVTSQMTFPTLQTELKAEPSLRGKVRPHKMEARIRSRTETCLRVANAAVAFPSHFGIAYFAKVGPEDNALYLHVLNVLATLLLLDGLYICDACDADGVPDLTRSSGKHTEEHHLIRCLAPDDEDEASSTDHRLTLIEGRLDGLQTQLNDLTGRVGDLTGRTGDLTGRIGDLTGHIGDLNARIGNIEQLLHRLIGASEGRTA
jgi:hypothetical protein